jgi:hypothetical protein
MDEDARRALVQARHEAVQGVIAHRGGVQALKKAALVIEALQGVVVKGVTSGSIPIPQTREELARLLNRWVMAAHEATGQVALEVTQEGMRLEGEARVLTRQLATAGADNVIPFPNAAATPPEEAPRGGKVRRRKKA